MHNTIIIIRAIAPLAIVFALTAAFTVAVSGNPVRENASASLFPPAIYRCVVQIDNSLADAGIEVKAYIEDEDIPRGSGTTDENGIAIVTVAALPEDIERPLSFRIGNKTATETPDVDVTLEAPTVLLEVKLAEEWVLQWGLNEDIAAVNLWKSSISIDLSVVAIPESLAVIWHYGQPEGWTWFRPSWDESTLTELIEDEYYMGIATSPTVIIF